MVRQFIPLYFTPARGECFSTCHRFLSFLISWGKKVLNKQEKTALVKSKWNVKCKVLCDQSSIVGFLSDVKWPLNGSVSDVSCSMHTTLSPPASSQPTTPYAPSVGCAVLTCLLSSGISVLSTLQEGYPVWFLYSHNFQVKTNVENLSCISFPHTNKGRPYLKMMKTGWPLT